MIVFVADLKPGMVLASDVKGVNGRLLLPAGTVLEEQHLRVFNIWGVSEAEVRDTDGEPGSEDEQAQREAAHAHADVLFRFTDMSVEPMPFLKKACTRMYADILAEQGELIPPPEIIDTPIEVPDAPLHANVREILEANTQLGAFPDIYYRIMEALDNPLSTANTLAGIISKEPGICARLLSLVNSPLYGYSQRIDSLSRAVSLVGTKGLSQLALGVTVMDRFKGLDDEHFTMADFWKHSLACAAICRILASQIPGMSQDLCFVAGMLHDLGRLVLLQLAPAETGLVHRLSRANGVSLDEAEQKVLGFDHCQVAEALFRLWNFPEDILEATVYHHDAEQAASSRESAICATGEVLATAMQYGSDGNEFVHAIAPGAWDALGIPQSGLATTMLKACRQIDDILTIFLR